jgi:Mg2+-importing ATPase
MSLHPQALGPESEATARVARAIYPDGDLVMRVRDELANLYTDQDFADLFPTRGLSPPRRGRWRGLNACPASGAGELDGLALHAADVGISVDTAADVAKDAASIVQLEKVLDILTEGVRLGRRTFASTLKYLFVTTSADFGNMASGAAATLVLPFLPLLPLQIPVLNFLTDLPGTTIATDAVDHEQLERPGAWDLGSLRTFMIVFGLVSSAFDALTFVVVRGGCGAGEALFRSGWFPESVGTELAVMLVLRTRRPFFRSRPSATLLGSSLAVAVVALAIPFGPAAEALGFVPAPAPVLLALGAITGGYVPATEVAKRLLYRYRASDGSERAAPRPRRVTGPRRADPPADG